MEDYSVWIWKPLEDVEMDSAKIRAYEKIIRDKKVKKIERKDKLIWTASNDGIYSVINGCKVLINSKRWEEVEIPLKLSWDPTCLLKVGFFLWLAFQNRILTTDRINKIGIVGRSRCVLCKNDIENVDNLLYSCPYSQICWEWFSQKFCWSSAFPKSFKDFLKGWPSNLCKGTYSKLWNIFPSILIWEVWKERKRRIFSNIEMKAEEITLKIEASIIEIVNSYLRKTKMEEGSFSI